MRRVAAVVVACTGVGLIVAVFVFHGFQHAYDGEHIMGQVRPALTANGTIFRNDLVVYDRGTSQLFGSMLPALEADANTGGGAIDEGSYPAVTELRARSEEIGAFTNKIVTNIERHRGDFAAADAIPTKSVPLTATPYVMIATGLALTGFGLWALRSSSRWPLAGTAVIGIALVVVPLATSFPTKADHADRLLGSLQFSPEIASGTRARFAVVRAGSDELETKLLPDLAAAAGRSRTDLDVLIAQRYPEVSELRKTFPGIIDRFDKGAAIREDYITGLNGLKQLPITTFPWLLVAAGVLLVATTAVGTIRAGPSGRHALTRP
jgi:hypothetical protein